METTKASYYPEITKNRKTKLNRELGDEKKCLWKIYSLSWSDESA